jgi:hypothetical protein
VFSNDSHDLAPVLPLPLLGRERTTGIRPAPDRTHPRGDVTDGTGELRQAVMSQKTVQLVIARLLTDEDVRLQFLRDAAATLHAFRDQGFELTASEMDALLETDREFWAAAARRIDPRLQRCSIRVCRGEPGKGTAGGQG